MVRVNFKKLKVIIFSLKPHYPQGSETQTISGKTGWECVECEAGFYSSAEGSDTCTECASPDVSLEAGQSSCAKCEPGTGRESSSTCRICKAGEYSEEGLCKPCPFNHFSEGEDENEFFDLKSL